MSVKLTSRVWETTDLSGSDLILALALADIADDEGNNVRPSVSYLAWKANASERTVQNIFDKWITSGALVPVAAWDWKAGKRRLLELTIDGKPKAGRGILTVYKLDLAKFPTKKSWDELRGFQREKSEEVPPFPPVKGAEVAPFSSIPQSAPETVKGANCDTKGCNLQQERVQSSVAHIRKIREVDPLGEPGDKTAIANALAVESPPSPNAKNKAQKAKNPEHPELDGCCKVVWEDFSGANPDEKLNWHMCVEGPVKKLLTEIPSMTAAKLKQCCENRRATPGTKQGELPKLYLTSITNYLGGVLDRFNKPQEADEYGGHYEGDVYVFPDGQRATGYRPPMKRSSAADLTRYGYEALAQKVTAELCLNGRGCIEAIDGAIAFCVKFESKTPDQAVDFLIARAKEKIARRDTPSRFWFEERKWWV